jgi:ankyrin repeat protein
MTTGGPAFWQSEIIQIMKTKFGILVFLLAVAGAPAQTNDLTALLQQGLFEEQANRNLDAAIEDYASLARQFDKDRQLAATAVFRLGECFRAQGKTNEAAAQYQRILRDFSDQQTLATLSRQDLTGMGVSVPQPTTERTVAVVAKNPELVRQLELVKKLQAMTMADIRQAAPTLLTDATLINLIYQYNQGELDLLRLRVDHGEDHPEVKKTLAIQDELGKKITERLGGLARALALELAASGNGEGAVAPVEARLQSVAGEEEQEIQRIQTMIQNSPDLINAPGEGGNTPLNKAAYNGWLKVAAFLLDHGADVNAGGIPPLNSAASAGNRAMSELLLSRGANVNSKGALGKTPLAIAVEKNYPAVAEVLLANKADVNAPDEFGNTPLVPATEKKQVKLIQALLTAGANLNLENKHGQTPFSVAAASGSPEIVKQFLAAKADPNGGKLDAPLLAAIHAKDVASVELLLQAGANPNAKGEDDWQPSALGAFGRPVGRGWETPIALAVSSGQLPMVKLLLKFKADPNVGLTDGQSVLFGALSDTNMLAALLEAGGSADAGHPNAPFGWTLLDGALASTNLTAVQLLLKFKADPNDSNYERRSILFRALNDTNMLESLLDAGAKVDPVSPDETEWTPLGNAVRENNAAAVEILLKHGANPNFHNRNGVTPLHHAAYARADRQVFELLFAAKADPNVRTGNGKTPLDALKEFIKQTTSQLAPGMADAAKQIKLAGELADLLRQHGALDELPDFTRIRITRQGLTQPLEVFRRGASLTNHFTLLETAMRFYNFNQVVLPGQNSQAAWSAVPFPDFGRILIRRPSAMPGGKYEEIKVSLLDSSNVVDCAQDVSVKFGDVIEIPESVHALNAVMPKPVQEMETSLPLPQGATFAERLQSITSQSRGGINSYQTAKLCLQKSVQLVVAGETNSFKVNSWKEGFLSQALGKTEARSALRSSSDLSRVTVTRKMGDSGQPSVFTMDVTGSSPNPDDLWLQDSDVITVPEKP